MRVVAYLRVSTDRQAEEGLGLEIQERAIRKWARAAGHRVVAVHRDGGQSGGNGLDTRLGLAEALDALRAGKADALVVYRLDRLARDLVLQESLLADIRRLGAELFSTSATESAFLTDADGDPSRALVRQVLGAVSQYERSMIALRMKAGRVRKAERGGYAGGKPPFGYRANAGQLEEHPEEQRTLERIRALRKDGLSLERCCRVLEAEGLRARRSTRWHVGTLGPIVDRLERMVAR